MFDKIKDIVSDVTGGKDLGDLDLGGYEKYLDGITWPVDKNELISAVKNNGASDEVVGLVENLGGDRFNGPEDIIKGLTGGGGADAVKAGAEDVTAGAQDAADSARSDLGDVSRDVKNDLKNRL